MFFPEFPFRADTFDINSERETKKLAKPLGFQQKRVSDLVTSLLVLPIECKLFPTCKTTVARHREG